MSKAEYKRLGDFIREVNVRNRELKVTNLLGVSISKEFMPCIAKTFGTGYLVLPYKPNISLIHSILYNKLFAYICKFLYLYIIILADIYA